MLLGGDLGFLVRAVVAFLVVIFVPVVGFVRRKWRRSVARREEISRLLVLASEETARVELEVDFGYGYDGYNGYGYRSSVVEIAAEEAESVTESLAEVEVPVEVRVLAPRRLQYQCEVCSSPTTTRCASCKAVRYCSGKCQIIHWRQGHKDECHPFTFSDESHDMGGTSPLKLLKAKQNEILKNGVEIGGRHSVKAVDISSGETSNSSLSTSSDWEKNNEVECSANKKETISNFKLIPPMCNEVSGLTSSGSSIDASASAFHKHTSHSHRSVHIPGKTEIDCVNVDQTKPFPELSNLVNCEPNSVDVDTLRGSSTSSASSVDGCQESSLSEPSTPSSGFWDGTINLTRSRVDILDDTAHSCCEEAVCVDLLSSQLSSCCSSELLGSVLPRRGMPRTCDKEVLSNDPRISMFEEKKPTNGSSSPIKLNKEGLESKRSSVLSLETPNDADVSDFSTRKVLNSREPGELATSNDDKAGSLPFSNPENVNCKVSGQSSISQESKSVELKTLSSKASSEHLSSNYGTRTVHNVKSVKADNAHEPPACSLDFLGGPQNAQNGSKPSVWKVVDQLRASNLTGPPPLGGDSENVGKYNSKGLFPYDMFVKLYNWNKVELLPCGLLNCGNSCYANVVLQCLAFTPPLTAYFLQGLHSKACKKRDWCFACEFEILVLQAKDGNSPISPSRIISQLQNIGSNLGNGREEDAHEFLRYAIDTMQSGCLKEAGISASGSLEETTLFGLTFGGYLRSKIECMRCGGKSEQHDKMMDLTVEIEGDIGTLEEALRQFTHTETLDGENKYQCSRCKSYEKAKKKLRVLEAPNVLTIALKRFQSGKFGKLNKTIRFPEILNLAPYMSGTSDKSPIYRLYGVVVHLDIMNAAFSGHYVCYVKNTQNKWFQIDDSVVKAVELESVLTKGAYMLLYTRCSPRAPRLIRSTLVPRDPRKAKHPDSKPRYHARGLWDISANDSSNNQTIDECFCPNNSSFQPFHTIWEEDSSSDKSSSLFSEANSCSTDSSNRDSMCSDDLFDQLLGVGDMGLCWGSSWRNSSDSETSSSSSSPTPLYSRHSLHDLEAYASKYPKDTDHCTDTAVRAVNDRPSLPGHSGMEVAAGKGSAPFLCPDSDKGSTPFLCPDSTKRCRKLGSSSCRETASSKLGWINPFENLKSSVTFRRSMRERLD
ncbi:hypothetical protein ACH5RR_026978 [Cinchona calisaya]|uniref:ubiquitinyl hydrolase 1 n=1 Tax=Cinchona calisaya TaxID=153742 RepID=A0ABD2Z447_9GENT